MLQVVAPERRDEPSKAVDRIVSFMRGWSMEVTHCGPSDLKVLRSIVPAQAHLYASAIPGQPYQRLADTAAHIRAAGFEAVPHLGARHYADQEWLKDFLTRIGESGVRRVLVIAGDRDKPLGPFASAADVINSGLLQAHGIEAIGIAGYPDGHPRIGDDELDRALEDKIVAAARANLDVHIVTQFCFDAEQIVRWLRRLRERGIVVPVRIGIAGPTSIGTLLRFAQRCGVRASIRSATRQAGLFRRLAGHATPDDLIRTLADLLAAEPLGEVAPHFFSFGGLVRTASFARAVAAGRIVCDPSEPGFTVIDGE